MSSRALPSFANLTRPIAGVPGIPSSGVEARRCAADPLEEECGPRQWPPLSPALQNPVGRAELGNLKIAICSSECVENKGAKKVLLMSY